MLTQLEEVDREVIEMRHMQRSSTKIAELLEVLPEAIKSVTIALERFRAILSDDPHFKASTVSLLSQ
ncbi:MAG: hypothetical protein U0930_20410 [Pirellulales bacterium]